MYYYFSQILDEVYRILSHIKKSPNLGRAYKVTDELFDLSSMAMEYFKEHIEPRLPEITYFGSDFLDITSRFSGDYFLHMIVMGHVFTPVVASITVLDLGNKHHVHANFDMFINMNSISSI